MFYPFIVSVSYAPLPARGPQLETDLVYTQRAKVKVNLTFSHSSKLQNLVTIFC